MIPAVRYALRAALVGYALVAHLLIAAALFSPNMVAVLRYKVGLISDAPSTLDFQRTVNARVDASTPPGSAVFIGDSLTMALPVSRVTDGAVNFGVGGQTSAEMLESLPSSARTARVVFVMIGTNDILRERSAELPANYARTISEIPGRIVLTSPPPSRLFPLSEARMASDAARKACASTPRCTFVDLQAAMLDHGAIKPGLLLEDGVHLSPAGVDLWVSLLQSAYSAS